MQMTDKLALYENQLNTLIDLALEEDIGGGILPVKPLFRRTCGPKPRF